MFIQGISEKEISSPKQAIDFFKKGEEERTYASTGMNNRSSRSHVILKINVETRFKNRATKTYYSNFLLADLAGSESIRFTGNLDGNRVKEGANINKSLTALTSVIMKLEKKESFIPYRDSKLTRILQPVLSGNCKTNVICQLNCEEVHFNESLNTIRFGVCAGGVKLTIKENVIEENFLTNKEDSEKLGEILQKNQDLESQVFILEKSLLIKDIEIKDRESKFV